MLQKKIHLFDTYWFSINLVIFIYGDNRLQIKFVDSNITLIINEFMGYIVFCTQFGSSVLYYIESQVFWITNNLLRTIFFIFP